MSRSTLLGCQAAVSQHSPPCISVALIASGQALRGASCLKDGPLKKAPLKKALLKTVPQKQVPQSSVPRQKAHDEGG